MKNIVLIAIMVLTLTAFGQEKPKTTTKAPAKTTTKTQTKDKVVKKALYTKEEKEKAKKNFKKDIKEIGMSPEVNAKYNAVVEKHLDRIRNANKDRKMTKEQASYYVNKVIAEQNGEIKALLTPDQYKKHLLIMNRYQNSILYKIEQQ